MEYRNLPRGDENEKISVIGSGFMNLLDVQSGTAGRRYSSRCILVQATTKMKEIAAYFG